MDTPHGAWGGTFRALTQMLPSKGEVCAEQIAATPHRHLPHRGPSEPLRNQRDPQVRGQVETFVPHVRPTSGQPRTEVAQVGIFDCPHAAKSLSLNAVG